MASIPKFLSSWRRIRVCAAVLGSADEHFDEIVVEGVVELALKLPGKLRAVKIAGMDREHVGVHGGDGIFQIDQDLDESVGFPGREVEQWMVVEAQVVENFGELRGVGHGDIVPSGLSSRKPTLSGKRRGVRIRPSAQVTA